MELTWKTETRRLGDLKRYEKNPRGFTTKQYDEIRQSIDKFGLVEIPAINTDDTLIAGHLRHTVLLAKFGEDYQLDVRVPNRTLTDEEFREYLIRSNKNTGQWEIDLLDKWFDRGDLVEWGFEEWELKKKDPKTGNSDPDHLPAIENFYDIEYGAVITMGNHRLVCGDTSKIDSIENLMGKERADLMITDPPYGVDYTGKTKDSLKIKSDKLPEPEFRKMISLWFDNAQRFSRQGAYWLATVPAGPLHEMFITDWNHRDILRQVFIWMKDTMVMGRSEYHYKHEPILFGWIPGGKRLKNHDRTKTSVWEFDRPKASREHPTMKPVEMWVYGIENHSQTNDIVMDPFAGSGTTFIACEQTGRKCRGMELDPIYCSVIIRRWEEFTGKKAVIE